MTVICSVMTILLVGGVILIQGSVSGTEFAPSHFQTRSFSFHEIPFLHLQITPVKRTIVTNPAARQIRTAGYIVTARGTPPSKWHLVSISRGPSTTPALASLLTEALELGGVGGQFWQTWTTNHPQCAGVLWPRVQQLAQRELYVLIPELLQLARTQPADDGVKLKSLIDQWLVAQYVDLVLDMRAAKRTDLAEGLLEEAIADFPDETQLQNLVQEKLGKTEEDVPGEP